VAVKVARVTTPPLAVSSPERDWSSSNPSTPGKSWPSGGESTPMDLSSETTTSTGTMLTVTDMEAEIAELESEDAIQIEVLSEGGEARFRGGQAFVVLHRPPPEFEIRRSPRLQAASAARGTPDDAVESDRDSTLVGNSQAEAELDDKSVAVTEEDVEPVAKAEEDVQPISDAELVAEEPVAVLVDTENAAQADVVEPDELQVALQQAAFAQAAVMQAADSLAAIGRTASEHVRQSVRPIQMSEHEVQTDIVVPLTAGLYVSY